MSNLLSDLQKIFLDIETGDLLISSTNLAAPVVGYLHTQTIPSDHWVILHQEGTDIVMSDFFELDDSGVYNKIIPQLVNTSDVNKIEVFFPIPIKNSFLFVRALLIKKSQLFISISMFIFWYVVFASRIILLTRFEGFPSWKNL